MVMSLVTKGRITLKDTIILFDRDFGVSIFTHFRGYDNPVDDAEWLLERNMISKGFILRPVTRNAKDGLWIGEYRNSNSEVVKSEEIYDEKAAKLHRDITLYASKKMSERDLLEELSIRSLKKIQSSIIQKFKYYTCPSSYFYFKCKEIERVFKALSETYGDQERVYYSEIANDLLRMVKCEDVIICPLRVPNAFERIHNFNRAIRSRGLGELLIISPSFIRVSRKQ